MNIIATYKDLPIAVIGDIHGDFRLLRDKINYYQLENICLFLAGDFGCGFGHNDPREPKKEQRRLSELNDFLKKRKIFLYVIHGNHDSPDFFDGNHNFSNLIFMQDYDIVEIGEYKILGIGGATSVDRKPNHHFKDYRGHNHPGRVEGVSWWKDEKVVYNEEKLANLAGIDVAITHTAPDFVYPPVLGGPVWKWCDCDPELKNELIAERALMSKIFNKLDEINMIKYFVYGHFHASHIEKINTTIFKLLDIGEIYEIKFKKEEDGQ